jgi:hypothetical protein
MHRDRTNRVVYLQPVKGNDANYDQYTGNRTYDQRAGYADKRAARRYCYKTGKQPVDRHAEIGFSDNDPGCRGRRQYRYDSGGICCHKYMCNSTGVGRHRGAGLNPNQPSQSTKAPIVAILRLWPGIGLILPLFVYFPTRGPEMITPDSAAHPPTE